MHAPEKSFNPLQNGSKLPHKVQNSSLEKSSSMGDLLFDPRAARAGRAPAHPLQRRQTTLFAGLSITCPGSIADY